MLFLFCRCPVDNFVFPGLDRLRDGDSLEARFNAFKIPESNFLVFEATVRTCPNGCQPAYCSSGSGAGRNEPSFGRKRRDLESENIISRNDTEENVALLTIAENDTNNQNMSYESVEEGEEEYVREMIEVRKNYYTYVTIKRNLSYEIVHLLNFVSY